MNNIKEEDFVYEKEFRFDISAKLSPKSKFVRGMIVFSKLSSGPPMLVVRVERDDVWCDWLKESEGEVKFKESELGVIVNVKKKEKATKVSDN